MEINEQEEIPYMAVGNDELGEKIGDKAVCPHCGELHVVEFGTDSKTGKISEMLGFVSCEGSRYLVAIDGKKIK